MWPDQEEVRRHFSLRSACPEICSIDRKCCESRGVVALRGKTSWPLDNHGLAPHCSNIDLYVVSRTDTKYEAISQRNLAHSNGIAKQVKEGEKICTNESLVHSHERLQRIRL